MPFRRTRFRRRRRRRRTRRRGGLGRQVARLNRAVDFEKKYVLTAVRDPAFQTILLGGPIVTPFVLVGEGTGVSERDGQTCRWLSWSMNMYLQIGTTPLPVSAVFWLIQDRQPTNALATVATIFQHGLADNPENDFLAIDNIRRFKILKQWRVTMDPAFVSIKQFRVTKRLNMSSRYNGGGALIGAISSNVLIFVAASHTAVGANGMRLNYDVTERFVG